MILNRNNQFLRRLVEFLSSTGLQCTECTVKNSILISQSGSPPSPACCKLSDTFPGQVACFQLRVASCQVKLSSCQLASWQLDRPSFLQVNLLASCQLKLTIPPSKTEACLNLYPDCHFTRGRWRTLVKGTLSLIWVSTWPGVGTPMNKSWSYYYVLLLHTHVPLVYYR